MIKKIIKGVFSTLGLNVSRRQPVSTVVAPTVNPFDGYDYAEKGFDAVKLVDDHSMMAGINLYILYDQAAYCEKMNIPGAFVECGVWKGGAVGVMAKANLDYGKTRRKLHLFDAFDNICWPVAEVDGQKAVDDILKYTNHTDTEVSQMNGQLTPMEGAYDAFGGHGTIDICRNLLENRIAYPRDMIQYHKGWFQDTVPVDASSIESIAILRLDGDYYHSIKVCLDHLYDRVSSGGLVVIDDYGYYEGCTKAVDEFLEERGIKTFLSYNSAGSRYFVKA